MENLNEKKLFSYKLQKFDLYDNLTFNEKEKKIFNIITNVLTKYGSNKSECRVVGGWVRDKVNSI